MSQERLDQIQEQLARQLLARLNRLLRWYRALSGNAGLTELAQWQASPFRVRMVDDQGNISAGAPMEFVAAPLTANEPLDEHALTQLREGLASNTEPEVPVLFLLDAQYALRQGRFREAVLFAWATIDSQFSLLYDRLVNERLQDDYMAAREQLLGLDLSLRTKMSVILNLLSGRSLFLMGQEDGGWARLSASYTKRNRIIHRGEIAEQQDANNAVEAAQWVMRHLERIAQSAPQGAGDTTEVLDGESE